MKVEEIISLSQYVRYLEKHCNEENIIFRGQPEHKDLLPKIARSELRLQGNILEVEKVMFDEFKKKSRPFLDFTPESDLDWLALTQHHGLATRLLDWTKNPLAALWFVVNEPASEKIATGIVWVFEAKSVDFIDTEVINNLFGLGKTKVFQPNHIDRRIISQDGWFTVHAYSDRANKFVALNKNPFYKPRLSKLRIPKKCFCKIRFQLDRCGINSSTIFPELEGLCKHIVWLHSKLEDEV